MSEHEARAAASDADSERALWRWAGVAIFTLALALRVAHVLAMRSSPAFEVPSMDALYHLEWARAFAAGEDFQPGPFFRAPLYVWFLGLTQALFGPGLLAPRLVQCLFGATAAWLAWRVGRRLSGRVTGLLAGLAVATYWVLIYFDGELLIPTLIVPLDLAALLATLGLAGAGRMRDERSEPVDPGGDGGRRSPWLALGAGLAWGLSAIARPNVLLVQPVIALWLMRRRGFRPWRAGRPAVWVLYTLGVLAPIVPITTYNAVVGGDRVLISSQAGVNFWIGNNPRSDGSSAIVPGTRGGWWEGFHDAVAQAEEAAGRELAPSEVSSWYASRAFDWIASEPGAALRHLAWKLRLLVTDWELGNNQEVRFFVWRYSPVARLSPLGFPVLLGFGVLGLVLVLADRELRVRALPLWSFVLVYALSIVAFFVCSRFRVPLLPPLAILGAHAAVWCARRLRARALGPAAAGLGLALVVALGSSLRPARLKTSEANGYLQLGNLAEQAGEWREAEAHYRYAAQLDPEHPFALVGQARVQLALGRLVEARGALESILAIDPWRADALDMKLRLLLQEGHAAEVEALATAWGERAPHLASPWLALARLRVAEGRLDAALELFERALARDPRNLDARFGRAATLEGLGRPDEALAEFRTALEASSSAGPGLRSPLLERLVALAEAGAAVDAEELAAWRAELGALSSAGR